MSDLALYRKYRSTGFDDVLGQKHVVSTLLAALASGHTSHAYLFSGPRGTGKTSVARLLARSLSCVGSPKPCGNCTNCRDDIAGNLDIIEIDGASNRGIDEIRELRDKIALAPTNGRYKVYIIDEVHMLTDPAFNALLKTLEEPPSHAVFILATTEAHKLPETIISRTQHFHFKAITDDVLVSRLQHIAAQENIKIDTSALQLVARLSRGGFRDAISMLDQLSSISKEPLTAEIVTEFLGMGTPLAIEQLAKAIDSGDVTLAFKTLEILTSEGVSAGQVTSQLTTYYRNELQKIVKSEQPIAQYGQDVARIGGQLDALLAIPGRSSWPEVALEAVVARLSLRGHLPQEAPVLSTKVTATKASRVASGSEVSSPEVSAVQTPSVRSDDENNDLWIKALSGIKQQNNSLYALLKSCQMQFNGDQIAVKCLFNFHRDRMEEAKNRLLIEKTLDRVYGRKLRLVVTVAAGLEVQPSKDKSTELVSSALEILGGEVVYE